MKITMLFIILSTYDIGSTEHVIVSANAGPIETKTLLNSLAIVRLSFTVSLLIVNFILLFELHEFFSNYRF